MADEQDPLQHVHGRVGQLEHPLEQAAAGADAAQQHRHRDDRQRVGAGDERHQHAGVAVAGDQRRVGRCRGWPPPRRRRPGRRPAPPRNVAITISRRTGRPLSSAARTLPPTMRAAKPNVVRCISTQATRQATSPNARPQCTSSPGQAAQHVVVADRQRRRLVEAGGIAQRPLDQVVEERDGDVVEQQRADGLVDAAVGAQRAGAAPSRGRRPARRSAASPILHRRAASAGGSRPPPRRASRPAPSPPRRPAPPGRAAAAGRSPAPSASAAPPAAACSGTRTRSRTTRGTSRGRPPAGCAR